MPFQSKAQRRKFYALKNEGKMDQATIDEWEKETPKIIPERVKVAMSLFSKVAANAYASKNSIGSFLNWNESGGVTPRNPDDEATASQVGLKTLPVDAPGANCATCRYFKVLDEKMGSGFCINPEVKQEVTVRMLCDFWENPGTEMAVEEPEPNMGMMNEIDGAMQDPAMQQNPAMQGQDQGQSQDRVPAAPGGDQQAPSMQEEFMKQDKPKEDKPEEGKSKKGPQVNIKVDSGEKQASLQDFIIETW